MLLLPLPPDMAPFFRKRAKNTTTVVESSEKKGDLQAIGSPLAGPSPPAYATLFAGGDAKKLQVRGFYLFLSD